MTSNRSSWLYSRHFLISSFTSFETNGLEGKSSVGRLGIDIHATAGKGDVGFCNTWTLEISCTQPVRVYPGMPIGQLIYFQVEGDIEHYYNHKANAKYNQRTDKPVESMMWKNSF